jgi:hypothetical protein
VGRVEVGFCWWLLVRRARALSVAEGVEVGMVLVLGFVFEEGVLDFSVGDGGGDFFRGNFSFVEALAEGKEVMDNLRIGDGEDSPSPFSVRQGVGLTPFGAADG